MEGSLAANKGQDSERGKYDSGGDANWSNGQLVGETVSDQDRRDIRQHHAASRADDDRRKLLEACGKRDGGDLGFVADLGKEEGEEGRQKRSGAAITAAVFRHAVRE
jgi:hypothetical protein